jgi:hypothetical protein
MSKTCGRHCTTCFLLLFIASRKSNLCPALTTRNTIGNNGIIGQAQNVIVVQHDVFVTGICLLLVTKKGRSPFPDANSLPRSTANCTVSIFTCVARLDICTFFVYRHIIINRCWCRDGWLTVDWLLPTDGCWSW